MTSWLRTLALILVVGLATFGCEKKKSEDSEEGESAESGEKGGDEQAEEEWFTYKSEKGGYSVEMPDEPEEQTQDVPTALGNLEMFMVLDEQGPTEVYMASHSDYPGPKVTEKEEVMKVLRQTQEGMIGAQGTKIDDREIELDGNPGLEFNVDMGGGMQQKTRIFLINNRLYQVLSIYQPKKREEWAKRFVESFKLTP